jgi:hypothetical protein
VWLLFVGVGYGVLDSPSHACVVVFGLDNTGPLPREGGITTARGEYLIVRGEEMTYKRV